MCYWASTASAGGWQMWHMEQHLAVYACVWAPSLHVEVSYAAAAGLGQCLCFCK